MRPKSISGQKKQDLEFFLDTLHRQDYICGSYRQEVMPETVCTISGQQKKSILEAVEKAQKISQRIKKVQFVILTIDQEMLYISEACNSKRVETSGVLMQ